MSLTTRFLLGFAVVATVGLSLLFTQLIHRVERQYFEAVEEPMVDVANILAEVIAADAEDDRINPQVVEKAVRAAQARELNAQIYNLHKTRVDMQVYVTNAYGQVLFDSAGIERPGMASNHRDVNLTLMGEYGARSSRASPRDPLSIVMYVGAPIRRGGRIIGMVSVAKPQRGVLGFVWETERWLKWSIITTVMLMLLGIYMAARWATRPLEVLTQHALAVSRGERSTPPHMPGRQMKTLAKALEDMRDALEGREYVEHYVQSLTHELKSPVAAILGAGEILQGDVPEPKRARFLQNIRNEAARLRDLLERLLHLAAIEKQKKLEAKEAVDLAVVLDRAWDHLALVALAKEVRLEREVKGELVVQGDPWLLELAVGNLLQNAIDFAPKGSAITVRLYRFDTKVVCEIDDAGPGIPEYARERVFERFYSLPRPDSGKKSTGLGLCFVKEVALLHGGSAELANREGAAGARAMLILPG
ncbi:two-component system sensor histidine kinase CreC [Prosthecobacter sp.]|uniref:two-component system sensor histidine kinase CreC n=1 Tax=Prosthecobacter sp. TaxID=1965333 RepID=UPI0037836DB3